VFWANPEADRHSNVGQLRDWTGWIRRRGSFPFVVALSVGQNRENTMDLL
jgi:hypothetical protein